MKSTWSLRNSSRQKAWYFFDKIFKERMMMELFVNSIVLFLDSKSGFEFIFNHKNLLPKTRNFLYLNVMCYWPTLHPNLKAIWKKVVIRSHWGNKIPENIENKRSQTFESSPLKLKGRSKHLKMKIQSSFQIGLVKLILQKGGSWSVLFSEAT